MAKTDDTNNPASTSIEYQTMAPTWAKLDTLIGGTDAMRAAGQNYLPRHDEESSHAYTERLNANVLLNMVQITLDGWTGKPFNKPVEIGEDVPAELKPHFENIDLLGNNINVFSRNWFRDGLLKGMSHVLVEFPRREPKEDGTPRTLEDDAKDGVRPYLVHVLPENLIFAYAEVINGVETLLQVRIHEWERKLVGFNEVLTEQIRMIEPGKVTLYQIRDVKGKKKIWTPIKTYEYDLKFIPLVTFYADRRGFMLSKPPLADLADLNIRWWQSNSDQISVLTVARFPIVACSGAVDTDHLRIGPNQWLNTPDPAGRFYYLEHKGLAIEAGRKDLLDLEETMSQYGATFLKKRPGGASATAAALDSAETTSPLQDMAVRFKDALEQAVLYMAKWISKDDGGTFGINTQFSISDDGSTKLSALAAARKMGDVSRKRLTTELKRFGVLSEDYDFADDQTQIKAEPDVMPTTGTGRPKSNLGPDKTPDVTKGTVA